VLQTKVQLATREIARFVTAAKSYADNVPVRNRFQFLEKADTLDREVNVSKTGSAGHTTTKPHAFQTAFALQLVNDIGLLL